MEEKYGGTKFGETASNKHFRHRFCQCNKELKLQNVSTPTHPMGVVKAKRRKLCTSAIARHSDKCRSVRFASGPTWSVGHDRAHHTNVF